MRYTTLKSLLCGFFVVATTTLIAQENILPKGLTSAEKESLATVQFKNTRLTPPPSGAVRAAAEWEEVEYLVVSWQNGFRNILRQIVEVGIQECKVIIVTEEQNSVASYLTSNGVNLTNITFLDVPWDSIWIRDYGGNTIYSDDVGDRALVDWIYNRPRPNDDVIPTAHANLLGLPIYVTDSGTNDLVNTGGNYMSDGLGNAFASKLILEENEAGNPYGVSAKTESDIDAIMQEYMGIEQFIKMNTLTYDAIHHIDMHMKLLDEETLLVSQYPPGVADGPEIEANIDYVLSNFLSPFGTPYDVKWIPAPPSTSGAYPDTGGYYRTYSNALIINKSIIVPTYRPEVDNPALDYIRELMPGYNVVGVDVDNQGENLISLVGAIHCITHTIGVENPLWIVHQPIDEGNAGSTIAIDAMIKHNSGINQAKVYWREEGSTTFNESPMSFVSDANWSASLQLPSTTTNIEYYIWAEANSGKSLARPIVAPDGYWTIFVENLSIDDWARAHISAPYPNPTQDNVSFTLNEIGTDIEVQVTNLLGQVLLEKTLQSANGVLTLELQEQWQGTLLITFKGAFGEIHKKVIKL